MPTQAKRRFLNLDVEEVSMVGVPANEVEFLIKKSLEEAMTVKNETTPSGAENVKIQAAGEESVSKAVEHINSIVAEIANVVKAASGAPSAAPAAVPATSAATPAATPAAAPAGTPAAAEAPAAVTKAAEPATQALTIEGLSELITKAKQFTPDRIAKLKEAMEILQKLLIDSVPVGSSPATSAPGLGAVSIPSGVTATGTEGTPVIKTLTLEDITKAIAGAIAPIATKLEAAVADVELIKKARPPSNSIGGGETETNVEKKKSLFHGIV